MPSAPVSRRSLLASVATTVLPAGAQPRRLRNRALPDIVLVLADDLRQDVLGYSGGALSQIVPTPNIDKLAAGGVVFDRAYSVNALCSPSRACMLSGMYPHGHGTIENSIEMFDGLWTFPQSLQKLGYRTAYMGKWQMGSIYENPPGFEYFLSPPAMGIYEDPTFGVNGKVEIVPGHTTDILTRRVIEWLGSASGQPSFIFLTHKAPHSPFFPLERHRNVPIAFQLPDLTDEKTELKPEWLRKRAQRTDKTNLAASARKYLACVLGVDESVGSIVAALEAANRLDNTLFIFTSDNGLLLGEHGLLDKRAMYEPTVHLPLIMHFPERFPAGMHVGDLVLNIDYAPTIMDIVGGERPDGLHGESMLPLIEGTAHTWRESFLYTCQSRSPESSPDIMGVRSLAWSYATYPGSDQGEELYDLDADPEEHRNLATSGKRDRILERMRTRLQKMLKQFDYKRVDPAPPEVPSTPRDMLALRYSTVRDRENEAWDDRNTFAGLVIGTAPREELGRRFDGSGRITFADGPSFDTSLAGWNFEVLAKAEAQEGTLWSCGDRFFCCLYLQEGVPTLVVKTGRPIRLVAKTNIVGRWACVTATIESTGVMALYVDGQLEAVGQLERIINDERFGFICGAGTGESMSEPHPGLQGLLGSIVVWARARTAEQVAEDAAAALATRSGA